MKQAYTPGLEVTSRTLVTKVRELPLPGQAVVKVGDSVQAQDTVLTAELPGELDIVRIADQLGFDPSEIVSGVTKQVGDTVEKGEAICQVKCLFGLLTSTAKSPSSGVVEFFTEINGHLGVRRPSTPLSVAAYMSGKVTEVVEGKSVTIEAEAALMQGIFGVGGERFGVIEPLPISEDTIVTADIIHKHAENLSGKIIFGGQAFEAEALQAAARANVQGVITGSITAETLREFVGHEIGVSITGDEDVPFSFIVTEGFGQLSMSTRVSEWAKALTGKPASISGATQVRAGAMRPEVIVSHADALPSELSDTTSSRVLEIGSRVRIIRVPYFGRFGIIAELPHEPETLESGAVMRVLRVTLEDGKVATVPRANIELA